MIRTFLLFTALVTTQLCLAHPLRLSLCEIEWDEKKNKITVNLRLFLTDVNEALVFDPNSKELAFCQPNEAGNAESLLLNYLDRFFYIKTNNQKQKLKIQRKKLAGEGEDTALWLYFELDQPESLKSLEIKNAVFTDLFFDQNNIVYVHVRGKSKSLMLSKKTPVHHLKY